MVIARYVRLIIKTLAQHRVTLNDHSKAVDLLDGILNGKVHSEHEMPSSLWERIFLRMPTADDPSSPRYGTDGVGALAPPTTLICHTCSLKSQSEPTHKFCFS